MKTFSKYSLPETITYNKHLYKRDIELSAKLSLGEISKESLKNCVIVNVLSRNLRGKLDLHQRYYKPTQWVFVKESTNLKTI